MKKITIVIVDDHKLIRQLWTKMFADNPAIEITGESGTVEDAVEMIKLKKPDIVFLDVNLGQASGADAIPLIRKFSPGTRIIIVSMYSQPAIVKKMLKLGASAYVTKNSSEQEILNAIDEVMKGGIYICAEVKDILSDKVMDNEPAGPAVKDLSYRQIEIIKLLKEGLSSKEISSRINITFRTVEAHRYNILKKLKFKNTASLINFINNTDLTFI